MISSLLQISTQEPHPSPTFLSPSTLPNLLLSISAELLLLYDCQERFMDLISQFKTNGFIDAIGVEVDNDILIVAVHQSHISILSLTKSKEIFKVNMEAMGVVCLNYGRLGLICNYKIQVFDLEAKTVVESITVGNIVCYCSNSQDNTERCLYIGGRDGTVKMWNKCRDLQTIITTDGDLMDIQVLDDYLCTFTNFGCLKIWNLSSKMCLSTVESPGSVSFGIWTCSTTGSLQLGFGRTNGDVNIYNQTGLVVEDTVHPKEDELVFEPPHIISHKKSGRAIRSVCFVNGSLVFSGDEAIIWKYSLSVLED